MNLTKTLQESDLAELAPEVSVVNRYFTREREQHPLRVWEYSMALRACKVWGQHFEIGYDVGGAGSPFYLMAPTPLMIIDPDFPGSCDLAEFVREQAPRLADAAFCLSVLEHVDDLDEFLYHLSCLVRPGGLLFLTMDITEGVQAEQVHFAHMRRQIFYPDTWMDTAVGMQDLGFHFLDDPDWTYHGHTLYGSYSFASLAMVKRS